MNHHELISKKVPILIVGGGLGGVAAALAASDLGCQVILTEETDWLGGQMTSQAVPPDEHRWIEDFGKTRSYGELRSRIRDYYRRNLPLSPSALNDARLNPGLGAVSKICHLPRIAVDVIREMLLPAVLSGRLQIFYHTVVKSISSLSERVESVELHDLREGKSFWVEAAYAVDATETGDLLPLAGVDYVSGAESQSETGEPHAVPGPAEPDNVQAFTWCFPLAFDPTICKLRDEIAIPKPKQYAYWQSYVPKLTPQWSGPLLSLRYCHPPTCKPIEFPLFPEPGAPTGWSLWRYRRIVASEVFSKPADWHEVSLINWPQNDYLDGNLIDATAEQKSEYLHGAKQLSLSLAYWLQNEVPRPDGGSGYPGLHLRPDLTGTSDGLAKAPYIRESRRIKALATVTELNIGTEAREGRWPQPLRDSVGIGSYPIDLHPSTNGRNYIDIPSLPFQIPLGALIPRNKENLLAAAKNIGTTHITNGCYRLHPVEWNIGEAAGALAAFCHTRGLSPRAVWDNGKALLEFQNLLSARGIELQWPEACRSEFIS